MLALWSYDGKMVYESIIDAIEGFDSKHCVGVGGCGSVYKAELQIGQVVTVKKFHSIHVLIPIFTIHFLQARLNCGLNSCIILYFILLSMNQAYVTYGGN